MAQEGINSGLEEQTEGFYLRPSNNLSNTSLDSEALLDHRLVDSLIQADLSQ